MNDGRVPRGWRRWLSLPSRSTQQIANDVDDEVAFHLAMREAELRAAGANHGDAERAAAARFGDVGAARHDLRLADRRAVKRHLAHRWAADLHRDLQHGLRRLLRERGFSLVAVGTLALGLGTTVAVGSLVDRVLVSPLPYVGAERLHVVSMQSRDGTLRTTAFAPAVEVWRANVPSFQQVETVDVIHVLVTRDGVHSVRPVAQVSPGLLHYLRVSPVVGRRFTAGDTVPGGTAVAMLSWSAWTRQYQRDPEVVGKPLTLGDRTYEIVGVMPRQFDLSHFGLAPRVDAWIPMGRIPDDAGVQAIAVARPGAVLAQLQRELDVAHARAPESPAVASLVPRITPLLTLAGSPASATLRLMLAAVVLVLAIVCVNVASLLIARGAARKREWSVRRALGASRGRLIRQLVAESLVLTILGALGGVALARGLLVVAVAVRPEALSAIDDVQMDGRVAVLAAGLALLVGLLFGLVPAWLTIGRETSLHAGPRSVGPSRTGHVVRHALVFAELAISTVLAVAAMLLIRSAHALETTRLGYDVDPLVTMYVRKAEGVPDSQPIWGHLSPALARLRALPGVRGVSIADSPPGGFGGCLCVPSIEGGPLPPADASGFLLTQEVDSAFVPTAGLKILRGRSLSSDTIAREALITPALAHRLWPSRDAVGRRFRLSNEGPLHTVVGLIEVQRSPDGWLPADGQQVVLGSGAPPLEPSVLLRVDGSTSDAVRAIAAIMRNDAPSLRAYDLRPVSATVAEGRAPQRFIRRLLTSFAGLALLLAAIGLYGVMAYAVVQRHQEIGVRMALGAHRWMIARLIIGDGMRLCLAALIAGGVGSFAMTRLLQEMLFGVSRWDPLAYGGAAVTLVCVSAAALWFPTRLATNIDPVAAVNAN